MLHEYSAADLHPAALTDGVGRRARLGVIGNPIAHSKSPQMQQAALDALGNPLRYIRLRAEREAGAFEALLAQLQALGFIGVNVTVPFKKQACAAAAFRDPLAALSGAVNTLVFTPEGLRGYNTDGPGFERAVAELTGRPLGQLRVLLLGACGGAGSALACQCALSGCPQLVLVNRPKPELGALRERLAPHARGELRALPFGSPELRAAAEQAELIVNATSLGLREGDPLPLPPEWLHPGQQVCDIVTHDTPLRRAAGARGCRTANGLAMLLWQGAIAYRHWFGVLPPIEPMRAALSAAE